MKFPQWLARFFYREAAGVPEHPTERTTSTVVRCGSQSATANPGGIFIELSPEELEEKYRTGERDREVDRYFSLLEEIENAIKGSDSSRAIRASKASLPLLGALIREDQRFSGPGSFMIQSIPAIDQVGKIMAATGDYDSLRELQQAVQKHHELTGWQKLVADFIDDAGLAEGILKVVSASPGFLQRNLKTVLKADGLRLRDLCYWMSRTGRLKREKSGNSYRLFLPAS